MSHQGDGRYLTHDAGVGSLTTADGVSPGDPEFSLDEQTVVEIDNPPWANHFDTDQFIKLDTTVARPIEQTYYIQGDEYTFKKPDEELREAQWSLDNRPLPLTHPDAGIVRDVDDVHGFVRNPYYVDHDGEPNESKIATYIPVNDEQALEFIEDYQDVSVGFFNRLDWDADEDGVDAYQRDLFYDHVAAVRRGRCSGEDGCGLHQNTDSRETWLTDADSVLGTDDPDYGASFIDPDFDGTVDSWSGSPTLTDLADTSDWQSLSQSEQSDIVQHALVVESLDVPPEEFNAIDLFVVDADGNLVQDALTDAYRKAPQISRLGRTGVQRVRNRISELLIDEFTSIGVLGDEPSTDETSTDSTTMSGDCNCSTNDDGTILDIDDMSLDAVADRHPEVQSLKDDKDDLASTVDEKDATIDEKDEKIDELESTIDSLKDDKQSLQESLDEYRRDQFESKADELTDITDHWGDKETLVEQFEDDETDIDDIEDHFDHLEAFADAAGVDIDEIADGDVSLDGDTSGGDGDDGSESDPTTIGDAAGGSGDEEAGSGFDPETAKPNRA